MATPRASRSGPEIEDKMLQRVLHVRLTPLADGDSDATAFLESLAEEILREGGTDLLLKRSIIERVLMDRLTNQVSSQAVEHPVDYLINCYRRILEESKKVQGMKNKTLSVELQETLSSVKDLVVSYTGLLQIHPDMFPQPEGHQPVPSFSRLVAFITGGGSGGYGGDLTGIGFSGSSTSEASASSVLSLPPGFLDMLVQRFDGEGLEDIFRPVFAEILAPYHRISPLGPFHRPLQVMVMLVSYPPLAKVLAHHPQWLPTSDRGRAVDSTILGRFLRITPIPDPSDLFLSPVPSVRECFSKPSQARPGDINATFQTIRTVMHQLYEGLLEILKILLKSSETREKVLQFLGTAVEKNKDRGKIQMNPNSVATHGTFMSLSWIMLKLCEPFLDPLSSKKDRIDYSYVTQNNRMNFSDLTAIFATSDEVASWVDIRNYARTAGFRQLQQQREQEELKRMGITDNAQASSAASSSSASPSAPQTARSSPTPPPGQFHFICECFFLTARVLNIGLLKVINVMKELSEALGRSQRELQGFEEAGHDESDPQVKQLKDHVEKVMEIRLCYEAQLRDTELLQMGLSYYRLMAVWMASLLGGFQWPLPAPCPMEFASLPEHFVEDMAQLLLFASRIPHAYDGVILDEFMSFIVTLMGSPLHIKNPYLRAKFVAVLNAWMPAHCMTRGIGDSMATLFEGHQLALECMVPNLLKLYVDIEFTGSHTQFFDKFEIRHNIAELLEYLWEVPSHNMSWKKVAKTEESGFYLRFLNMLVNDAIYLLDESLNKLPELRDLEEQMKDKKAWESIPEDERREKERYFRQMESMVRYDMMVANYNVRMLQYTSAEISTPFLLPEMIERIAAMLNYFLLQLVGPQRKALKVRDPEKYEFRPKELLTQIVDIYLNLATLDPTDKFAVAVSSDGRSYRPEAFPDAAAVLRSRQLRSEEMIRAFENFGEKVKVCAAEAMDIEAMMGDIPDEFLDPIQFTLMNDPVILPSSRTTIDRAVIQRHLLSDQTDPFNRSLLTPDMLIPDTELKAKIEAFREAQRRKRHS